MAFFAEKIKFFVFCLIVSFFSITSSCNAKTKSVLKPYPTAVGDIVFSDGSAVSWSKNLNLTDEQKKNAVAVIFYAGKKGDLLGERLLGVGLHVTSEALKWAPKDTTGFLTSFDETKCDFSIAGPLTENDYQYRNKNGKIYISGDLDGRDNWNAICKTDSAALNNCLENYPAFSWAGSYGLNHSLSGKYADGWFLPSVAELLSLYSNINIVDKAIVSAGGKGLSDVMISSYWTSSQFAGNKGSNKVFLVHFENEYSVKGLFKYDVYYDYKSGLNNACAVYDFTVDD
ncbi:hypothetical protein [Treponema zioleckii]|uniref:hypothetical protein n=1 Tax=Treponema zioleckii TaxID=331680 RepID=UPI00168A4A1E|nr:hypothetical protein [Treponema zioleckii]